MPLQSRELRTRDSGGRGPRASSASSGSLAFSLIDTTLREGEQFARACFKTADKIGLARALDAFGVEAIELTSPSASPQSRRDLERVASLGLRARVLTHTRCHVDDVRMAIASGAQGVGLLFATSPVLRAASHGKSIEEMVEAMRGPIGLALEAGLEVRFSAEDTFRSSPADLERVFRVAAGLGVHRLGLADTVGIATPRAVAEQVLALRRWFHRQIGFHGHNDTGCAIANSYEAVAAGATHVDVSVLGLGERVGITPLGGFLARIYSLEPAAVLPRYRLEGLRELEERVAAMVGVSIPFNNLGTGDTAFAHKAGLHLKAVMANPGSYEAIAPEVFGRKRQLVVGSRLTGRHALAERAHRLGLRLDEDELRECARRVKEAADARDLSEEEVDALLLHIHHEGALPQSP